MEQCNKNINKKPNKLIQEKVLVSLLKSYGYLDTYNYLSALNVDSSVNNIRRIYVDLKRQNPNHIKINIIKNNRKRCMFIANLPRSIIDSDDILNKYISKHRVYPNEYNFTIYGNNIRYLHRFIKDNKSSDLIYKMTSQRNKKGRPKAIQEVKTLLSNHYQKVENTQKAYNDKKFGKKNYCDNDIENRPCDTTVLASTIFNSRNYIKEYVSNDINQILKLFIYRNYDRQGVFHEILSKTRKFLWKRYKNYVLNSKELYIDFIENAKKYIKQIGSKICLKRKIKWFYRTRILTRAYIVMKKMKSKIIKEDTFSQEAKICEMDNLSENKFPSCEDMYMASQSAVYKDLFLNCKLIDLFKVGYHSDIQIKVNKIKLNQMIPKELIDYSEYEYNTHANDLIKYNRDFYHNFKKIVCKELSIFKFKIKEASTLDKNDINYIKCFYRNNAIYKIKKFIKDNKILNKLEKEDKKLKLKEFKSTYFC